MEYRSFQLDTEWNMVHYPKRPNGFAVLVIGNENHFVHEQNSFWVQNPIRYNIIHELLNNGYTVFYSNLFGKNWGNQSSVKLAKQLYHFIMKQEILNKKIHVLADGMGALVAMQLSNDLKENIRSIVMINPILSIHLTLQSEKERRFFYKKMIKEICTAHQLLEENVESYIQEINQNFKLPLQTPIKLIHVISGESKLKNIDHYHPLFDKEKSSDIRFVLPEKMNELGEQIAVFFQRFENV